GRRSGAGKHRARCRRRNHFGAGGLSARWTESHPIAYRRSARITESCHDDPSLKVAAILRSVRERVKEFHVQIGIKTDASLRPALNPAPVLHSTNYGGRSFTRLALGSHWRRCFVV